MKWFKTFGFKFLSLPLVVTEVLSPLSQVQAAPCCARSPAVPMIVMGDNQAQINLGSGFVNVVAETDDHGVPQFGSPADSESNLTYRIDFSGLISDRLQVGLTLNYLNHSVTNDYLGNTEWGWGDTRVNVAYEFLPVWKYSEWKPQGYVFSSLTVPTGRPIYYSQSDAATDVMGDGFFTLSVGTLFTKRIEAWDGFIITELHYSLPREFSGEVETIQVKPGFGGSMGIGFGWSPGEGPVRIGMRLQPRVDQAKIVPEIRSRIGSSPIISLCDFGIDFAWMASQTQTLMLSYTDQTLIGYAINSNLNRIYALNYQFRWLR